MRLLFRRLSRVCDKSFIRSAVMEYLGYFALMVLLAAAALYEALKK